MNFRDPQPGDQQEVSRLLAEMGLRYDPPQLTGSTTLDAQVLAAEDGTVMAAIVAKKAVELILVIDPKLHPAVKLAAVRKLHDLLPRLKQAGYNEAFSFIPPEIEVPYSRRLRTLGWLKTWACWCVRF